MVLATTPGVSNIPDKVCKEKFSEHSQASAPDIERSGSTAGGGIMLKGVTKSTERYSQDQFVPLISTSGPDDSDLPAIQDEGQEYQSYSELGQLFQLAAEKRRRYGCSAKEADEHPLHCFDQLDWLFAWIREWDDSFDAQCGPRSLQLWSWWPDAT